MKLGEPGVRKDYEKCIYTLERKGTITTARFEVGKQGRLHFHCLFRTDKKPFITSYIVPGFNIKIKTIGDTVEDMKRVHSYILKGDDRMTDDPTWFHYSYAFDE